MWQHDFEKKERIYEMENKERKKWEEKKERDEIKKLCSSI